jgi:plastocyanin
MRARVLALFAVLVFPVVATVPAGAGGGGGGPCSGVSRGSEIKIRDLCFQGIAHVAPAGSTITVTTEGQMAHNIHAVDGAFASTTLNTGDHYQFTVDRPGVYEYYCTFHSGGSGSGMAGVLVVEEAASLAAARTDADDFTPAESTATTTTAPQPGSAWGWVALGALLLAGAALCVSLAVVRPRRA